MVVVMIITIMFASPSSSTNRSLPTALLSLGPEKKVTNQPKKIEVTLSGNMREMKEEKNSYTLISKDVHFKVTFGFIDFFSIAFAA